MIVEIIRMSLLLAITIFVQGKVLKRSKIIKKVSKFDFDFRDYLKCKTTPGCAPYAKLCDGVLDCADASDENITVCDELKYHKETALLKSKCQAKDQVYIYFLNYYE